MSLRLDWCSHKAAKYAVEHWHYSHTLPAGKNVYIGVWEDEQFIGCVLFGTGAGSVTDGRKYGLLPMQMAELTRVALSNHRTPVSRIVKVAIRLLRQNSPGLRLIVSFADPNQGHHGGIYQAGGWTYCGTSAPSKVYQIGSKIVHGRSFGGGKWMGPAKPIPAHAIPLIVPGKYRYLMPLDAQMRKQIEPLTRPYPKRAESILADATAIHAVEGGAAPTSALQASGTR